MHECVSRDASMPARKIMDTHALQRCMLFTNAPLFFRIFFFEGQDLGFWRCTVATREDGIVATAIVCYQPKCRDDGAGSSGGRNKMPFVWVGSGHCRTVVFLKFFKHILMRGTETQPARLLGWVFPLHEMWDRHEGHGEIAWLRINPIS